MTGIDQSAAYVAEAAARAPSAAGSCVGDVGDEPLPRAAADLVYARYLLIHLPDVPAYVEQLVPARCAPAARSCWRNRSHLARPTPTSPPTSDATFALVQAGNGVSWAGPLLAAMATPPGCAACTTSTVAIDVTDG